MSINLSQLANGTGMERVIVYVKHFEVLEDAPPEAKMLYHPVAGELYKAFKDTNTGMIYLDVPEALERDGGGWAFTQLSPKGDENLLDFELIEVTKENALDINLIPEMTNTLANWLEEDPLVFSWENDEQDELEVVLDEDYVVDDLEAGADHALSVLKKHNPQIFAALSIVTLMLSYQEEGLVPQVGGNQKFLTSKQNRYGIPTAISALLDSHVNRATIPNMVGIIKLALLEISRLTEAEVENFFNKMDKLQ